MRRLWWLPVLPLLWLLIASCAFLWLAGLWGDPRISWWSRPWIWITYARHGDGSFSERLYLIVSAAIASAPAMIYVRFFLFTQVGGLRLRPLGNAGRLSVAIRITMGMPTT